MTIQEIINILQKIALTQPNVRSVGEGDIYDSLNAEGSTRYAYFFITQNRHQQIDDIDRYSLNIFYVDRLEDDKSNKLQIQSIGKEVLGNVFNVFCEEFDIEVPTIEYQVFTERFSDYCAGVYATVAFEVMRETDCADFYDGKYGQYIPVKIINQSKSVRFTQNGIYDVTFDAEYTGLENVEVDVDVDVTQYIEQGRQEGFDEGFGTGVQQGRQEVYDEAQDLYVEQNGVYQGENLYKTVEVNVDVDSFYNQGVEAGKELAAAAAVVLDATSNGTYYTKYADIPEWTEPATGDDFYSYASMYRTSFDTGYKLNADSVVEFWYRKQDYNFYYTGVIGVENGLYLYLNVINLDWRISYRIVGSIINNELNVDIIKDGLWHHFKISKDGVWVDGVRQDTAEGLIDMTINPPNYNFTIGCAGYTEGGGDFGMVKIDGNVYIPTNQGYIQVGGDSLPTLKKNNYTFQNVEKPVQLENLIKQVNVTVPIKAYDAKTGLNISFQYSNMTVIPDYINFEGKTNWCKCFEWCEKLQDVTALRNIKINNADSLFRYCSSLTDLSVADTWDFSDCTNMNYMFDGSNVADLSVSSYWSTSKVTDMGYLLAPSNLVTVGTLDCTSITASNLNSPMYFVSTKLKNVGGFLNIKTSLESNYTSPSRCPDLTKESYINIFNGLYDFTANGETPNSNQGKIKLHSNAYTFLTDDDIAIATNKGWTVS